MVNAAAALASKPASIHVLNQKGAGAILGIAEPGVDGTHDGEAGIQPDEVGQRQRSHGLVGAQLHARVDVRRGAHPLQQAIERLINHGHQHPVHDESWIVLRAAHNLPTPADAQSIGFLKIRLLFQTTSC